MTHAMHLGGHYLSKNRPLYGRPTISIETMTAEAAATGNYNGARIRELLTKGVDVYVRLDWKQGQSLPVQPDFHPVSRDQAWIDRWQYGEWCKQAALDGDLKRCKGFIFGNETNLPEESREDMRNRDPNGTFIITTGIPADWVAECTFAGDGNNAASKVKSVTPSLLLLAPAAGMLNDKTDGSLDWYPVPTSRNPYRTETHPYERYIATMAWHMRNRRTAGLAEADVKFALHAYVADSWPRSWTGTPLNLEPARDIHDRDTSKGYLYANGAEMGTHAYDDQIDQLKAQFAGAIPDHVVSEWAGFTEPFADTYEYDTLWRAVEYLRYKPGLKGLACFVDATHKELYGVTGQEPWARTSMRYPDDRPDNPNGQSAAQLDRLRSWNYNLDTILRDGW